jgi:mannose-6-phosphate isomerase-like protein (cupin superfamily)
MYVTEGTASVLVGDTVVEVKAGGWHLRPRNILHTFWNATDQPLRFIDMYFNQPLKNTWKEYFLNSQRKTGSKKVHLKSLKNWIC